MTWVSDFLPLTATHKLSGFPLPQWAVSHCLPVPYVLEDALNVTLQD